MFEKFKEVRAETKNVKEARAKKKNKDVAALISWQETRLKQLDEQFSAAAATADDAEKILKLQELIKDVGSVDGTASSKRLKVKRRHASGRLATGMGTGAVAGGAALIVPAAILFPPLAALGGVAVMVGMGAGGLTAEKISEKKAEKVMRKNPELGDFVTALDAQVARAQAFRDETIKNCRFEEVSLSPHLKEALEACSSFREHFASAAATATQQALEEKAKARQAAETVKTPREPGRPNRLKITP